MRDHRRRPGDGEAALLGDVMPAIADHHQLAGLVPERRERLEHLVGIAAGKALLGGEEHHQPAALSPVQRRVEAQLGRKGQRLADGVADGGGVGPDALEMALRLLHPRRREPTHGGDHRIELVHRDDALLDL